MSRVFTNGLGNRDSILGRVIPNTLKWYLMSPCLTLSIIRYRSRVKWSNPGIGVVLSPTPRCRSYWKRSLRVTFDEVTNFTYLYIYWESVHIYVYIYIYASDDSMNSVKNILVLIFAADYLMLLRKVGAQTSLRTLPIWDVCFIFYETETYGKRLGITFILPIIDVTHKSKSPGRIAINSNK